MPLLSQPLSARALPSTWRRQVASVVAGVAVSGLLLSAPSVVAQDGTSGAPPLVETGCVLVPASSIDAILSEANESTPVASAPMATPVGVEGATPVASPVVEETAFEASLLLEDLTASATSIASCLTESRYVDLADRTSPLFRGQLIGIPEPVPVDVFGSLASTFPETAYEIVEIGEAELVDPTGTATAEIIWQVGHQVRVDQWTFVLGTVQGVPMWIVDRAAPGSLEPGIEAEVVEVTIADDSYSVETDAVDGEAVRFDATNTDSEDHELLVVRLENDADTSQLLTTPGPSLPEGISYIGQATIPGDASGRLLLADLEPGRYAIVCLLPDEDGVPHLADGMEIAFDVE